MPIQGRVRMPVRGEGRARRVAADVAAVAVLAALLTGRGEDTEARAAASGGSLTGRRAGFRSSG
ncbi:hypothetical protein [Streptomyces sp. NPDC093991]|uniref:hypothetical protein n=1 Tax=unclassified Streptomyces TaxID=2593676 RepID=UPI00341F0AB1